MLPLLSPGRGDDSPRFGNAAAFGTSPRTPLPPPEAQHLSPKILGRKLPISPSVSVENEGSTTDTPRASTAVNGNNIESGSCRSGNNATRSEPRTLPLQLRHSVAEQHNVSQVFARTDGNGGVATPRDRSRLYTDDDDAAADADANASAGASANTHGADGAHGGTPAANNTHGERSDRAINFEACGVTTPRTLSTTTSPSSSSSASSSTSGSPRASASHSPSLNPSPRASFPTTASADHSSTMSNGADATLRAHEHRAEVFADW